jgi:hypothetical protein
MEFDHARTTPLYAVQYRMDRPVSAAICSLSRRSQGSVFIKQGTGVSATVSSVGVVLGLNTPETLVVFNLRATEVHTLCRVTARLEPVVIIPEVTSLHHKPVTAQQADQCHLVSLG